jgi:hypothetical protein
MLNLHWMFTLALELALCCTPATCAEWSLASFVVTNDDVAAPSPGGLTFYPVNADGTLGNGTVVATGGNGTGGGNFGLDRVIVAPNSSEPCVYASDAGSGDIAGIDAATLTVTGRFKGSNSDNGVTNGIGLAANSKYLYAAYTTSYTIATFQQQQGCTLQFTGDLFTFGLSGGWVSGMAVSGNMMVVAYGDGSVESFDLSGGAPVSNGDAQYSTGSAEDVLPNGVAITRDGHYAIFGDASTRASVEVSDISSGKLAPTLAYLAGTAWNSANVRVSPDETVLFAVNNSSGQVTAAFFDKTTGVVTPGCTSLTLRGFYTNFAYAGNIGFQLATGAGGTLYVPEFGSGGTSYVALLRFTSSGSTCTLTEAPGSPLSDPDPSSAVLSLAVYPAVP